VSGPTVALIAKRGKFLVAEPFFAPGPRLAVSRDTRYAAGDLVLVGAGAPGRGGRGGGRARVLRRIGRPDVAREVIEALMLDRGLRRDFDPAVQRAASASAQSGPVPSGAGSGVTGHVPGRRDLRRLATITIDPFAARDFDDAISCEPLADEGTWRLWVHIADVAAYVPPRGPVDREALRRGTSVYVPGAVEPMLPAELSSGACSLLPGEDRLALSVEMLVRGEQVLSASFARSVIRSDRRLTYDQVDEIFAGRERASGDWGAVLEAARAAAAALTRGRERRGALQVVSPEPEFSFDARGHVVDVREQPSTESHRLVEVLMIAANEQVARFLESRRIPTLYRVHERPEQASIRRLLDQLASLDVPTPPLPEPAHMTPQQTADAAGEISRTVSDWVTRRDGRGGRALNTLVLRALRQAIYDDRNRGHAGLGLRSYCHFTSPIRRYPDLICHRALLSALGGEEPSPEASFVAAAGPLCSERERAAMTIERDADDVARCFLLERRLLESGRGRELTFEGEVVGLIAAGAFLAFGEELVFEGMLAVRRLRGEWWELNQEGTALIGSRGGALRLGDPVRVRVERVDAPRGRVDLAPVE
jgi:ribonuclease R